MFSSAFISCFSVSCFSVSSFAFSKGTTSSLKSLSVCFCSPAERAELSLRFLVSVLSSSFVPFDDSALVVFGGFSVSSVLFLLFFGSNQKLIDIVLLEEKSITGH